MSARAVELRDQGPGPGADRYRHDHRHEQDLPAEPNRRYRGRSQLSHHGDIDEPLHGVEHRRGDNGPRDGPDLAQDRHIAGWGRIGMGGTIRGGSWI